MSKERTIPLLALLALSALAVFFYINSTRSVSLSLPGINSAADNLQDVPASIILPESSVESVEVSDTTGDKPAFSEAAMLKTLLTDQIGESIQNVVVQTSLKELKLDLIRAHGEQQGSQIFAAQIQDAFPVYADQIQSNVEKMLGYEDWFAANAATILQSGDEEFELAILEKRRKIFGDDMKALWGGADLLNPEERFLLQQAIEQGSENQLIQAR